MEVGARFSQMIAVTENGPAPSTSTDYAHMVTCRYAPLQPRLGCSGSICNFVLRAVKATTLALTRLKARG
jgi:hypothetical protein